MVSESDPYQRRELDKGIHTTNYFKLSPQNGWEQICSDVI